MPRSISSYHSDEDSSMGAGTPYLPTLTQSQRQRFLEDQKRIIRHIIRSYARDRTVFYTSFDTPGVSDAELEELLGETTVIYEIIFDQTSRTVFTYYHRDLSHSTFTQIRGERRDIPEGPPDYDSNGSEIISEEAYFSWEEADTDEE